MRISKLVSLGAAALLLAFAAGADEPQPATAEATPAPEASAAPAPEAAKAPEAAPAEAPPAAAPEAAPAPAPAEAAAEAPAEASAGASPEAPAPSEAAAPAPEGDAAAASAEAAPAGPAADAPALGPVGYDAQGRPGRVHVVVKGDTLWDISDAYLGTPWVWPSIWKDNQEIHNPHLIHPGDRIWITPSEMRKVTPEEAAALLAGQPAAGEPAAAEPGLEPEAAPGAPAIAAPEAEPQSLMHVVAQEGVGLVTPEALEAAGSVVSAVPPRIMLSQGDGIFVGIPEGDTQKGDQFTIFRVKEKVFDPDSRRLLGYHVDILGWAEIEKPSPETSLAQIRESYAEIGLGDRLMPRAPVPADISVQASPGDVDGKISFLANKRTQMGTLDFVYLNRGALDGLAVGSPLEVYRQSFLAKEETRKERVRVPERVIAQLLVVKAEPMTAVAFVTHTEDELTLGDHFRGKHE
jgi:hypothetical protein